MATKTKDEPQTDMTVGDALNVIGQFKGVWRALEKIEDTLLVTSRAEGRGAELEAKNRDLEAKTEAATKDYEQTALNLSTKQETLRNYEQSLDQKLADAKRKFDADMAELSAHYSETSVAARDKVAADLKAEQARVDELTAKKSDLQRDVRMLEAEVETLSKKKGAL